MVRKRLQLPTLLVVGGLLLATGCVQNADVGDDSEPDGASSGDAEVSSDSNPRQTSLDKRERAVRDLAKALCDATYKCPKTGKQPSFTGLASVEECKSLAETKPRTFVRGETGEIFTLILSEHVDLDESHRDDCIEQTRQSLCTSYSLAPVDNACLKYLQPAQEEGEPCAFSYVCKGDLVCDNESSCMGTCVPSDSTGPSCASKNCGENQYCVESSSEGVQCKTYVSAGESCDGFFECEPGTSCYRYDSGTEGRCIEHGSRTAGESCTDPAQCEGTLTCSDNDTCRPVELVGEGNSCGSADFLQACRPSLSCEPSLQQSDAICASLAGLDESCAPSHTAGCKPGLFCTQNEVCRELRPMGADCLANRQCTSEHCRDGTCAEVHFCPNAS